MKDFYKTITPEILEECAEKVGLGGEYPVDLKKFADFFPKKYCKILEVGCGTGRLGVHLITMSDYVGIDFYETYLDYFKERLKKRGLPFRQDQLQNISFLKYNGKNFDAVIFPWTVMGDFTKEGEQIKVLGKAKKLLSEKGVIILDNPANGAEYNTAPGYEPVKFYFDDWKDKFSRLGFNQTKQILYTTPNGRNREVTILYPDREA
jgi:SAM-dependent methyltransferase